MKIKHLKILQLDYDDLDNPYAGGGQAKATSQIYKRLSKKHKITVVTGNYPGAKTVKKDGITFERLGIKGFGSFVSLLSFWAFIPFYTLMNSSKYDVILESFTAPFSTSFVPLTTSKRVIGICTFFNAEEMSKKYKLPFHWLQNMLLKNYRYCISLTQEMKTKVETLSPKTNVTIIPRGIEKNYFNIPTGKEEDFFLYIGRIDIYQKGLDLLVKAWRELKLEKKNTKLYIAGIGKREDTLHLQELLKKADLLDKTVFFKGKVVGDEKLDILKKAKAVIYPSRYETFGNVALESLSSAKPFICFDIVGFKWIPEKLSIKVETFNVKKLVQAISKVEKDRNLQKKLGLSGREFARSFDWDNVSKKYEEVCYKSLQNL